MLENEHEMGNIQNGIAHYHLPGLFEFYELYRAFLPLFREHREFFYDWCAYKELHPLLEAYRL